MWLKLTLTFEFGVYIITSNLTSILSKLVTVEAIWFIKRGLLGGRMKLKDGQVDSSIASTFHKWLCIRASDWWSDCCILSYRARSPRQARAMINIIKHTAALLSRSPSALKVDQSRLPIQPWRTKL